MIFSGTLTLQEFATFLRMIVTDTGNIQKLLESVTMGKFFNLLTGSQLCFTATGAPLAARCT
jgi:hypothetical protein